MSELIQEFTATIQNGAGTYTARVRADTDSAGNGETTQSIQEHLRYWASGLSPRYLELALLRAHQTDSSDPPAPPPL